MSYTRKRALLACDFCRHRKRRCDGEKPCSTCREASSDCNYQDLPTERLEPSASSSGAVVDRLSRIEALLEEHGLKLNEIAQASPYSSTSQRSPLPSFRSSPLRLLPSSASVSNRSVDGTDTQGEHAQFFIPEKHTTPASYLLTLPQITFLIGDFTKSYFFDIEAVLPLPPSLDLFDQTALQWPSPITPESVERLTEAYFAVVQPIYPLLTRAAFEELQTQFFANGATESAETAVCYCVWALGYVASRSGTAAIPEVLVNPRDLGLHYFQPALRMVTNIIMWTFTPSIPTCQALLLASIYIAYLGRPLHSWKLAYCAIRYFLHLTRAYNPSETGGPDGPDDASLRVFWSCFMIECDRVAELDVIRTGVEPLADTMPLPRSVDAQETDSLIYFVAETAIRRLLNRIHNFLYSPESEHSADVAPVQNNPGLSKLLTVSAELNRQLEGWYASIPRNLQPSMGTDLTPNERGKILRLRYYTARQMIHRPFILCVAQQARLPTSPILQRTSTTPQLLPTLPRIVLEKSTICIDSCEAYLLNSVEILDHRSPYLWTVSQGCLACVLVLVIAKSSPRLAELVPDIERLAGLVVPKLRKWATTGSSFDAELKIIEALVMTSPR